MWEKDQTGKQLTISKIIEEKNIYTKDNAGYFAKLYLNRNSLITSCLKEGVILSTLLACKIRWNK